MSNLITCGAFPLPAFCDWHPALGNSLFNTGVSLRSGASHYTPFLHQLLSLPAPCTPHWMLGWEVPAVTHQHRWALSERCRWCTCAIAGPQVALSTLTIKSKCQPSFAWMGGLKYGRGLKTNCRVFSYRGKGNLVDHGNIWGFLWLLRGF